ncbi:MAG: glycosyltransferase family 39 protein [Casimicrobiaceae bacterium]
MLELRGLYFPDEGRYAEIPREMIESGDWVTPRLNGFPYFEKPPLQYWLTAAIFAVAGEDEWTARLVPALAGLGALFAVLLTARRLLGRRAGWMAAAVMASSLGYFLATQFVTLDMLLTAALTCALCAFLRAQDARATVTDNRRWMLVAWALCALAVLTKGPVGVVLPALAIATYVLVARDLSLLRRLHITLGLMVLAVITLPWFLLVEARNPGFSEFFFVHEHWQRFTQPLHHRAGPIWYFIPILVVFLMPWLPAMAWSIRDWKGFGATPSGFSPGRFAWCWAGAILVFFSVSSSKLPAYVLPAMGAIALAVAAPMARRWTMSVRITAWTLVSGGVVTALAAVPVTVWITAALVRDDYASSVGWVIAAGLLLSATGIVTLRSLLKRQRVNALAVLVLGAMTACQLGAVVAYEVDRYFSAERLIERISGGESLRPFRPELPFYSVDTFDHTVPFYLGRQVILVKEKGELDWGIARAPRTYIAEFATFEQRWRDGGDAYAIMAPSTYEALRRADLPMRLIDTDGRRVVVTRN